MINIKIDPKILYQLLISEERYGCTRNNHLMPSSGFKNIKEILNEFYNKDKEWSLTTAKQLCEEVINELNYNFYDGLDDEFGNREEYINFIYYLIEFISTQEPDYKPYNWDDLIRNIKLDKMKRYQLKDYTSGELFTEELFTKKEYLTFICEKILNSSEIIYTKEKLSYLDDTNKVKTSYIYHFTKPITKDILVEILK